MDKKSKLLKKYQTLEDDKKVRGNRTGIIYNGITMRDGANDELQVESQSSQLDSSRGHRKRIRSDDQDQEVIQIAKPVAQSDDLKSKRLSKNLRKALGLKKGEDINEFMKQIKIDGIKLEELQEYIRKNNNITLESQSKRQKKQKKKKQKYQKEVNNQPKIKLEQTVKLQNMYDSGSSDLDIPQQSRTIYRNKDGTIREHSQKQSKQIKKQQVLDRLAEWQKGLKVQQNEEYEKDQDLAFAKNKVWDDPLKRWEQPQAKKLFECKFAGYANRFNIKPGHRWDGVIRGNGFQNKYLQEINLKKISKQKQHLDYMKNL